ncbi:MAG: cyclic nucleotide-binding domain-containing protein [Chloroflexota bacterium]
MLRALEEITLFDGLEEETQRLVERHFEPFSCRAGTVVFEQGDPAVFLYLILGGSVTIRYKPYDGPPINLTNVLAGGAIGWSSVVGNPAYTSGAMAREDLQAIRIRGSDLRDLVARNPRPGRELLDRLASLVSNRWKDANRQVRAMLEQAVPRENASRKGKPRTISADQFTRENQLRALLERLSAYVEQFHGGTVDFVSLIGNRLVVRLGGACLGCPLLPSTLHGWVAGTVHQFFPEIEVVSAE